MAAEVIGALALAEDGCYDFLYEGVVIGRLLWIPDVCTEHPIRGWWLSTPGTADELIYRVPDELLADLPRARAGGVSMSLGIARHMLGDRVEGLQDGPPKPAEP